MRYDGALKVPCGRDALSDAEWEALGESLGLASEYLAIVKGIFDDHTNQRIAADLRMTVHAIDMRMRHLYMHLGVHSRPQVIVKVFAVCRAIQET